MTEIQMLIGSLSNDLFRVANLAYRGSEKGAQRFLQEAKRWSSTLKDKKLPPYIQDIVDDIEASDDKITMGRAEKLLMYGVLLQNYSLHNMS